jgi:beta-mannosidase
MKSTLLNTGWTLEPTEKVDYHRPQTAPYGRVPAQVPGNVHMDLYRANVIPHPFAERYEGGLTWIDETNWTYRLEFAWTAIEAHPRQTLLFHGVDTVCEVWLNGEKIAENDNYFIRFEVEVTGRLQAENVLEVRIASPVRTGEERREAYLTKHNIPPATQFLDERAFVRKPGYMSGWDWGPRLVSAGIWQPVELVEFSSRIKRFEVHQTPLGGTKFRLQAEVKVDGDDVPQITYQGEPVGAEWEVDGPLWWPVGEGDQPLQVVEATLPSGDRATKKIGLRTIEFMREKDDYGTNFHFVVNGRPIWARGANWIPNDSFPGEITDESIHDAIWRYATIGMNMLRVWGGGQYETDAFYDACDEAGILVWQDFPYACSYYPDDEDYQAIARREAEHQVNRLRDRTSLALWCGNNENRAMFYGTWGSVPPPHFMGEAIYDVVLKDVCARLDPSRSYIESSPLLVPKQPGVEDPTSNSDDHYWEVWHGKGDWGYYKDSKARFSSEFGFASSCSMSCWKLVTDRELTILDPTTRWHDKTNKPWDIFRGLVEIHYPQATDLATWIYTSQLNQRDAMRAAIEHYRGGDRCRGALIWQANDCWPVQSWALEDYRRLLKPAGWELCRVYAPVLIAAGIDDGVLNVIVANDSPEELKSQLNVSVFAFSGQAVTSADRSFTLATNTRGNVLSLDLSSFGDDIAIRCRLGDDPASDRWVMKKEPKEITIAPIVLTAWQEEDELVISGLGLVLDLVVWNEESPAVLSDPVTGLSGFRAVSSIDPEIHFRVRGEVGTLAARSLAGFHEVQLVAKSLVAGLGR